MSELVRVPNIQRRQFDQMLWVDPKQVLVNLHWIELNLPDQLGERTRRLRTNQLSEWHEARHAALFAFGIADQVVKTSVLVSKSKDRDFDFVMRWQFEETDHFYPVQLKELPPGDLPSDVTLDDIFDKLQKYSGIDDLSVVIALNRQTRIQLQPWTRSERPRIKELWYLGCESPDQTRWFLFGSVLSREPRKYEFRYPEGYPNVA